VVGRSSSISAGGLIFDAKPWLALGFGVVAFSLIFWLPLVRGITRTIGRMKQTTRQIADGRLDVRVNLRRYDELGALGESIDQMAARLSGLVAGQKRSLGDIAHELCSPLARLQMALGILELGIYRRDALRAISHQKAEQIAALVGELLSTKASSCLCPATRTGKPPADCGESSAGRETRAWRPQHSRRTARRRRRRVVDSRPRERHSECHSARGQ
jgi:two-component system sensor histidine kinase CpxA